MITTFAMNARGVASEVLIAMGAGRRGALFGTAKPAAKAVCSAASLSVSGGVGSCKQQETKHNNGKEGALPPGT